LPARAARVGRAVLADGGVPGIQESDMSKGNKVRKKEVRKPKQDKKGVKK
jgi:hypothetical protein